MTYSTHLLPGYSSWFEFYSDVKPLLDEPDFFCYEDHKLRMFDRHRPTQQVPYHHYSVRYIEQQTLAELYELRAIQTFSRDEWRHLQYALQLVMKSEVGHDRNLKSNRSLGTGGRFDGSSCQAHPGSFRLYPLSANRVRLQQSTQEGSIKLLPNLG